MSCFSYYNDIRVSVFCCDVLINMHNTLSGGEAASSQGMLLTPFKINRGQWHHNVKDTIDRC